MKSSLYRRRTNALEHSAATQYDVLPLLHVILPWIITSEGSSDPDRHGAFDAMSPTLALMEGSSDEKATIFQAHIASVLVKLIKSGRNPVIEQGLLRVCSDLLNFFQEREDDEGAEPYDAVVSAFFHCSRGLTALLQPAYFDGIESLEALERMGSMKDKDSKASPMYAVWGAVKSTPEYYQEWVVCKQKCVSSKKHIATIWELEEGLKKGVDASVNSGVLLRALQQLPVFRTDCRPGAFTGVESAVHTTLTSYMRGLKLHEVVDGDVSDLADTLAKAKSLVDAAALSLPEHAHEWTRHLSIIGSLQAGISAKHSFQALQTVYSELGDDSWGHEDTQAALLDACRSVVARCTQKLSDDEDRLIVALHTQSARFALGKCSTVGEADKCLEITRCLRAASFFPEAAKASADAAIAAVDSWRAVVQLRDEFNELGVDWTSRVNAKESTPLIVKFLAEFAKLQSSHEALGDDASVFANVFTDMNGFRTELMGAFVGARKVQLEKCVETLRPRCKGADNGGDWQDDIPAAKAGDVDTVMEVASRALGALDAASFSAQVDSLTASISAFKRAYEMFVETPPDDVLKPAVEVCNTAMVTKQTALILYHRQQDASKSNLAKLRRELRKAKKALTEPVDVTEFVNPVIWGWCTAKLASR